MTFPSLLAATAVFALHVPLVRLFDGLQAATVVLSIMGAAVLVRLNRGMPTLEWKSLNLEGRTRLTTSIVELSQEYANILAINAIALLSLVSLTIFGKATIQTWPPWVQHFTSGFLGGLLALCVARMAYVIWRDVDVVRLQKHLIDESAARDANAAGAESAAAKVADIRAANLRRVGTSPPKAWGE